MDALAPPLKALLYLKLKIQTGTSTRESIREYVKEQNSCDFAKRLSLWLFQKESSQEVSYIGLHKPYRKMLIEVLDRGLDGEQILKSLDSLEEEMIRACEEDVENQIQKIPFIILIPLLLLQVPALLLLGIGPLVLQLLKMLY